MNAISPVIHHVTSRPAIWAPGRQRGLWVGFVLFWSRLLRRRLSVLAEDIAADRGVFRAVPARPAVCDLLDHAVAQAAEGDFVCLFNADCLVLRESALLAPLAGPGAADSLLVLQRGDILWQERRPAHLPPVSKYTQGYDAFIMHRDLAVRLSSEFRAFPAYRLGQPWWDYAFLLMCLARGIRLHDLPDRFALLHLWHDPVFRPDAWNAAADEIRALLAGELLAGLGRAVLASWRDMTNQQLATSMAAFINAHLSQSRDLNPSCVSP